jgi:hypothetical protein
MASASAHRVGSDRVQLTVAELLGRYGTGQDAPARRRPVTDTVPDGWPTPGGSPRLRLALTAGSVLAAGSLVCTAVLYAGQPHGGGALGSETTEGGHPVGAPLAAPSPQAAATRRQTAAPVVRTAQVRRAPAPARARVAHPATPAPVERVRREPVAAPVRGDDRPPAGSALSMLTRPVDSLLHALG